MQLKNEVAEKTEYNAKIKKIEDKIPDITNLATKPILNTKINEVKTEIPSITNLATNTDVTGVENKIPDVGSLVTKTDYDTKINKIEKKIFDHSHDKYANKLTAENFAARLAQANLVTKTDFDNKLIIFNKKINSNKTKHLTVQNEFNKLETFDSIYFRGKSQSYLVFQTVSRYFKTNDSNILSWKSKELSDESNKPSSTSNKMLNPSLNYVGTEVRIKFRGDCLNQEKISFDHGKLSYNQLSNARKLFVWCS